jgi:hypothetical protein
MEHKARRYHNPRLRLPSLPPATNFAASIACMASFAAARGNHGWGHACVGLRPKDLALIGAETAGVAPSVPPF